ncbi:hypothetical protein SDJN02_10150, partial [Cucurbita argyrosperma subsp. argyrosperma]
MLWRWKMGAQRGMKFDKSGHIPICSVLFSGVRGHEHAGALVQFQENHNLTRLNRAYVLGKILPVYIISFALSKRIPILEN